MKRVLASMILILTIQYSHGQACGVYRIKYVGIIKSKSHTVEKISLPTIPFLHELEDQNSEYATVEISPNSEEFQVEIGSHLTSNLFGSADNLLKFYKLRRETLPIKITVREAGVLKEIPIELTWDQVEVTKIEDEKFGNLFELNLGETQI